MILNIPVGDLHCDLLSYLANRKEASPLKKDIGCALPYLQEGQVKMQVMAIYTNGKPGSYALATKQLNIFEQLPHQYPELVKKIQQASDLDTIEQTSLTYIIPSIENASGFCEEGMSLQEGFANLEALINATGRIFYIGLTHHLENRFGGGNTSQAGLKEDGKALLEYLDRRKIAIDLSHASDALAEGIFQYLHKKNLQIPILASHSNFRNICPHVRNLPDELLQEIIYQKGVIGINFLRAYVDTSQPEKLMQHILYGIEKGCQDCLSFGADFFYTLDHPDKGRIPFYFEAHQNAGKYPEILSNLQKSLGSAEIEGIAYKNMNRFLKKILP